MKANFLGVGAAVLVPVAAQAVTIPVTYVADQSMSWVAAGVNTPVATSPTTSSATAFKLDIRSNRHNAQTFTTGASGFTLDKIWIHYQNVPTQTPGNGPGTSMELRLFTVADPLAASFVAGTNLFPNPQEHVVPVGVRNDSGGNFAIFDVENIALAPNQSYAIQFITPAVPSPGFPYRWSLTNPAGTFAGGGAYSVVGTAPTTDFVFALEAVAAQQPPTGGASVPEPASALLVTAAVAMGLSRVGARGRA